MENPATESSPQFTVYIFVITNQQYTYTITKHLKAGPARLSLSFSVECGIKTVRSYTNYALLEFLGLKVQFDTKFVVVLFGFAGKK